MRYPIDVIASPRGRVIDRIETASPIPRTIVQIYRSAAVPRPIHAAVTRWQEMNPEFDHQFFDHEAARGFIEEKYPAEVLQAFDALRPAAFRADLWRYCYLAEHGGVYVDIRMEPLLALRTILDLKGDDPPAFVAARDLPKREGGGFMFNAFIAAAPAHPFVVAALARAVASIQARDYGRHCLDITGPACLGAAFNRQLDRPEDSPIELGDHERERHGRYRILDHRPDPYHRSVVSLGDRPCVATKCIHGRMSNADPLFSEVGYDELYRTRQVFR